jgi:hypothetical protein
MISSSTPLRQLLSYPAFPAWFGLFCLPYRYARDGKPMPSWMEMCAMGPEEILLHKALFKACAREYTLILHWVTTTKNSLNAPEVYRL